MIACVVIPLEKNLAPEIADYSLLSFCTVNFEIGAEKTKLMTNNTSGINTETKVNEQKFETITSFSTWAQL